MHEFFVLPVSPLQENCFILCCKETKEAAIIDAGDEADRIMTLIEAKGYKAKLLINTHCHVDHVSAVAAIQERLDLPFLAHPKEKPILDSLLMGQQFYGFGDGRIPTVTGALDPAETVKMGNLSIEVIETPGHTPGGVCLKVGDDLFTGDTLFAFSIGRTDLPGGNTNQLMESIKNKLLCLPPQTRVHPGHGPSSSIGVEAEGNPFLQGLV